MFYNPNLLLILLIVTSLFLVLPIILRRCI
ncbi:hypothetical protein SAMN05216603_110130 [Pseudomonas benzenivorans]|nr:hypothetical protein SAMN05216603_110130 [Pseudomonas benzenivorans]